MELVWRLKWRYEIYLTTVHELRCLPSWFRIFCTGNWIFSNNALSCLLIMIMTKLLSLSFFPIQYEYTQTLHTNSNLITFSKFTIHYVGLVRVTSSIQWPTTQTTSDPAYDLRAGNWIISSFSTYGFETWNCSFPHEKNNASHVPHELPFLLILDLQLQASS